MSENSDSLLDPAGKRAYNRRLFRTVAPRYALVTRALSFGRDGVWKRLLVGMLPRGTTGIVVDCACGPGDIAAAVAQRCTGANVVGVDLTPEMIAAGRRSAGWSRVQGDMARLPVRDGSADVVTGGYALRNAPDLVQFLREVGRVLRPGGVALFLDFSRPANPLVWRLQWLALAFWGGLWGLLLHGDPSVYGYIARSLALYPDRRALGRLLAAEGFVEVRSRTLLMGFVAITTWRRAL